MSGSLPAGACDSHIHVFGPNETYPLADTADFTPATAPSGEYAELAARLGLDRVVVVQPSVYGFDNNRTVDAVTELGADRARAVVHLQRDARAAEISRLHDAGARGVRFITRARGGPALDDLETIAASVAPFGWHVQLYLRPEQVVELADRLVALPVPFVLDHSAGLTAPAGSDDTDFATVARLLDSGRGWVKIGSARASSAGPPYSDLVNLTRRLIALAPERCVFGTDWPHPNTPPPLPDDTLLLARMLDAGGDTDTRHRVLVDNPALLYGFAEAARA